MKKLYLEPSNTYSKKRREKYIHKYIKKRKEKKRKKSQINFLKYMLAIETLFYIFKELQC